MYDTWKSEATKKDMFKITELAKEKRRFYDIGTGPLGESIFKLVRKLGINLIFLPVKTDTTKPNPFSALYVSFNEGTEKICFIGINTEDYFDQQMFALAHELYHHWEESDLHVCRLSEEPQSL